MPGTPPKKHRSSHRCSVQPVEDVRVSSKLRYKHQQKERAKVSPKHKNQQQGEQRAASQRVCHVSRIPWTKQETAHVQELLDYLSVQLQKKSNKLPRKESKQLLHVLQEFLAQDELDRNDPLLSKVAYYFQEVQCVDLDKVALLLKDHKKEAEILEGQDVILLLGGPSSGKTTTLHSLAGTTFEAVDADGFVHLQPKQFLDSSVAGYETSCRRASVTKTLQTCTVNMHDHDYVICDTPAIGYTDNEAMSIEEEIAHSHGMVEAFSHARTVRPVFVLSQDCLGNRMAGFPQLFDAMNNLFNLEKGMASIDQQSIYGKDGNSSSSDANIPFQYVFTRFDERYRTRLSKMFNHLHDVAAEKYADDNTNTQELFEQIVDDMVEKTTPEANIVNPVEDIPRYLLRTLLQSEKTVCEPRAWLKPCASEPTKAMLHAQLKLTLYGILMFLASQDYPAAVEEVKKLKSLVDVLLGAREYYEMALKACKRYAMLLWESYQESMENNDFASGFVHVSQSLQLSAIIPDMSNPLRLTHRGFWDKLAEITIRTKVCMPQATVRKMRDMTKYDPDMVLEMKRGIRVFRNTILKQINKTDDVTKACLLLMVLIQMSGSFKEAAQGSVDLLDSLETRLMHFMKEKEYTKATKDLVAMGQLTNEFPSETKFAHYALKMLKHGLDRAFEKNKYDEVGDILFNSSDLQASYPAAEKMLSRGIEKLWKTFGYAIKQREYVLAISVVKHMGKVAHASATAYDRCRLGIEVIRDRLFKTIQSKNYDEAQVLMQQLNKLEKMLPKSSKHKFSGDFAGRETNRHVQEKKVKNIDGGRRRDESRRHSSPVERSPYPIKKSTRDYPGDYGSVTDVESIGVDDMSELTMDAKAKHNFPKVIKAASSRPSTAPSSSRKLNQSTKVRRYPQPHHLGFSPYPSKSHHELSQSYHHNESLCESSYASHSVNRYESPGKSRYSRQDITVDERATYPVPQSSRSRLGRRNTNEARDDDGRGEDEAEYGESLFSCPEKSEQSIQPPSWRPHSKKRESHLVAKTFKNSYHKDNNTSNRKFGSPSVATATTQQTLSLQSRGRETVESRAISRPGASTPAAAPMNSANSIRSKASSHQNHHQNHLFHFLPPAPKQEQQHRPEEMFSQSMLNPPQKKQLTLQVHASKVSNKSRKDRLKEVDTMLTSVLTGTSWANEKH